jgi:hypothetical protein
MRRGTVAVARGGLGGGYGAVFEGGETAGHGVGGEGVGGEVWLKCVFVGG